MPGNAWAHKAPVLALSVATLDRADKPNRHAYHDLGLATENLVIQAVSMGLTVHMMARIQCRHGSRSSSRFPRVTIR